MANTAPQVSTDQSAMQERRRNAMAALTCSSAVEIARHMEALGPLPAYTELRPPQNGLVMLRGRIGGDGAPFNVGEATVTRCAVRLESGETGFGYVLGRSFEKSRLIALVDALLQCEQHCVAVEECVVQPISRRLKDERERDARRIAATKVEFFTLARGED